VKRAFFLLNAACAMAVLDSISRVQLASFVFRPQPYRRKFKRAATEWNKTLSNGRYVMNTWWLGRVCSYPLPQVLVLQSNASVTRRANVWINGNSHKPESLPRCSISPGYCNVHHALYFARHGPQMCSLPACIAQLYLLFKWWSLSGT
jgi:hypothetical protein